MLVRFCVAAAVLVFLAASMLPVTGFVAAAIAAGVGGVTLGIVIVVSQ